MDIERAMPDLVTLIAYDLYFLLLVHVEITNPNQLDDSEIYASVQKSRKDIYDLSQRLVASCSCLFFKNSE